MANRFWVGDGGDWTDNTNHWSASSGGAPNASLPTSADSVFFDASSFTIGSQTVTVDTTANCLDMDWTGATDTPTFAGIFTLNIFGSLTFIAGMIQTYTGLINFKATSSVTITVAQTLAGGNITFNGTGGVFTLQDVFNRGGTISLLRGELDTNGQAVTCGTFTSSNANVRTLTLGASVITCTAWTFTTVTNLTFTANTSTIKVSGTGAFDGGGLTYNDVELNGSAHTISGSNTFATLTLQADTTQTITFTDGTTQTITTPVFTGSTGKVKTLTGSSTGGWIISDAAGTNDFSYLDISYSTAQGGAVWQALLSNNNTDSGNNSGWIFSLSTRGWMRGLVHSGRRHRFAGRR